MQLVRHVLPSENVSINCIQLMPLSSHHVGETSSLIAAHQGTVMRQSPTSDVSVPLPVITRPPPPPPESDTQRGDGGVSARSETNAECGRRQRLGNRDGVLVLTGVLIEAEWRSRALRRSHYTGKLAFDLSMSSPNSTFICRCGARGKVTMADAF